MLSSTRNWLFPFFLIGIGIFFFALMLKTTLPYLGGDYDVGFLLTKQNILYVDVWRYAFYTHITFSLPVLLFGFLQVSETLRKKLPKAHRLIGKFYIGSVLLFSAPSGFVMALYANGGFAAKISFTILSMLWWLFTFRAYTSIRSGQVEKHRAFVYRSFALTLSAITLRTYVFLIPKFVLIRGHDLYVLVSWLSWMPNLLIAEIIILLAARKIANQFTSLKQDLF
jgi:uncharacterized membrane protein